MNGKMVGIYVMALCLLLIAASVPFLPQASAEANAESAVSDTEEPLEKAVNVGEERMGVLKAPRASHTATYGYYPDAEGGDTSASPVIVADIGEPPGERVGKMDVSGNVAVGSTPTIKPHGASPPDIYATEQGDLRLVTPGTGTKYTMSTLAALFPADVWEIGPGVYQVNQSITISSGDALEIYPGETLYFNTSRGLYIEGTLWANGTVSSPIQMENLTINPWEGVYFNATSAGTFENITISYGNRGVAVYGATVIFHSLSISNTSVAVYISTGSDVTIYNSLISNCTTGIYVSGATLSLSSSVISNCSSQGLMASASVVTLYQNDFLNNTPNAIYLSNTVATIQNNIVMYNDVGMYIASNSNIRVEGNIIKDNRAWGLRALSSQVLLGNNTIINNGFRSASGIIFYDGFESGTLNPAYWSTQTTGQGRVTVSTYDPYAGSYSLLLDDSAGDSIYSIAAAILTVDLSGYTDVNLSFWYKEYDDEYNSGLDGVFISTDGVNWYEVFSFASATSAYQNVVIDIDAAAAANGLSLTSSFQIKFQFYDNFPVPIDGYSFDEVMLVSNVGGGVNLENGATAIVYNNIISDNAIYGIAADGTSSAKWYVDTYGEGLNNDFVLNDDIRVLPAGFLRLDNVTVNAADVAVDGLMTVDNSIGTVITNNVVVDGTLYLNATLWEIAVTFDGEYFIKVNGSGTMIIQNGSSVVSLDRATAYDFWVYSGGTFHVFNSTIGNVGYDDYSDPEGNHTGLWINSTSVQFYNATFQDMNWGVVLHAYFSSVSFPYCTFRDSYIGITNRWLYFGSPRQTEQGTIYLPYTTFDSNTYGTLIWYTTAVYVTDAQVTNNMYGLFFGWDDTVTVERGIFTGNNYGVWLRFTNGTVTESAFTGNDIGVRVYNPGSNEEYDVNVVVSRNTFDGNTYGVSAYSTLSMNTASGQAYVNLDVSGNTFSDNTYGVYIYDNPTSPVVNGVPSTVVSRYDIYGNTVVNGTYGLYYLGYTDSNSADATLSSQVYIYSNTIISSERGIFVFAYTLSDSANSTSTVYASVTGNTIQDPYANMNNGIYVYVYISDTDPYASTVNVNYEISGNSITMADNNYGIYASMSSSGRGSNIVTLGISSNAISHADYGIYIDYRNSDNVTEYVSIDDNTITQMVWSGVHITEIDMSTSSYTISGNTITYCYRGVYVYATNSIYISSTGLYGNVINYNTYGMYLYSPGTTTLSLSQNANDFDSNQFGVYVRGDVSATVTMQSESFWNESYAAVYVYSNGDAYVDVLSSAFSTVGRGVFITADYAYIDISSNTMNDVTYAGIYVTVSVFSTGTISHNTLSNCLRYGIYAERGDMLDISYNAITDSVWYSGYAAIYVYLGTYTIGYNTLQNNGYMGIYITTTSYVALEYNTVVNTGVYRYGSEWGVYVTNCANLSSMGNDVYDNQNGYYITGTEFAMTSDSVRSNDGYGIYVVNSRGDLINCYIADNIYEGLYAPSSSDVNIYADGGQFTVYNDDIFFYGNLTVRNGGEMVTTYGYVYLGSVANNEVGIYVESDGTLNAFDSYIGSWTGYYYLFRIYGQATIQGTTIDDVYAVEVYSIINFLESEVVDAWYAGIVVNINGLVIEASSFRNCNIGVLVNGYALTIRGGYFNYNEIGLEAINANLTLIGVRFYYSDDSGVYISGGTATITSAYFYGNDRALYVESAEVTIDDAQFSYNDYGIYATNSVLGVVQPYFSGNTYGIMATGNSTVDVDDGSLYDVLSVYARETSTVNLVRCDLDTKTLLATENAIINVLDDVDISVVNYDGTPVEGAYVEFNGTFGKYNATLPEGDAAILIMFGRATSSGWEDANYTITYTNGYITRTEEWDGSTSLSLVLNRYAPSVVAPAEPVRAVEGQQVQFPFVLDDGDIEYGDVMNYEILYAPDGLSVANGTITWTPTSDYAGTTAHVTFRVTDSGGASTVATVYIYVEPVNDAPQIQNILASQTDDGYVQFLVLCSDPDGDMLNATLLIDDTTAVPLTPAGPAEDGYYYTAKVKLSEGKHTYRVIVSDGENVVSSEQKTLDIPINLMPYIALIALIVAAGLILFLLLKRRREGGEEQTYSEGYIEQETVEDEEISEEAVEE